MILGWKFHKSDTKWMKCETKDILESIKNSIKTIKSKLEKLLKYKTEAYCP